MALTVPNARSLWQAMGVDYVWDDHDFGPNDADGRSISRLASISAYSQAIPMLSPFPSSTCSPPTLEIFHSFVWGRFVCFCSRCAALSRVCHLPLTLLRERQRSRHPHGLALSKFSWEVGDVELPDELAEAAAVPVLHVRPRNYRLILQLDRATGNKPLRMGRVHCGPHNSCKCH